MSLIRSFKGALIVSVLSLVAGFCYGGLANGGVGAFVISAAVAAGVTTLILGVLEFTFSMDNAVVNAKYLDKLEDKWQRWFLTWGLLVAVFGMRMLFPLVVVGLTAHLWPTQALHLAFAGGDATTPGTYAYDMVAAHPAVAAFGGVFLLQIFLDWASDPERELHWLSWLERPLAKIGKLDQVSVVISLLALAGMAKAIGGHEGFTVLFSGACGLALYLVVNALDNLLEAKTEDDEEASAAVMAASVLVKQTGRAALMTVLFLEILDASFSFDGVIGAFAITADPIIIALGLGLIGAVFVRSLTVYLVRQGTLAEYEYLEHGAHWSIGVLAVVLLGTISHPIPDWATGLIGVLFVGAAFISSKVRNNRAAQAEAPEVGVELTVV